MDWDSASWSAWGSKKVIRPKTSKKPCRHRKAAGLSRSSSQQLASLAPCSLLLQPLNASTKPAPAWPRRSVQTYKKELQWLIQRASIFAQLPMHRRTPLLARGPRGPTDSYFRAWAGFYSASSLLIISARHELALPVLKHWKPGEKWLYHVHAPGLSSKRLPSPPTAFRPLRDPEASSQ